MFRYSYTRLVKGRKGNLKINNSKRQSVDDDRHIPFLFAKHKYLNELLTVINHGRSFAEIYQGRCMDYAVLFGRFFVIDFDKVNTCSQIG